MIDKYESQSELFEDESKFGAMCGAFLVYGVVSFLALFLVCWLALDSFWWGLLFGLMALVFFLFRTLKLSMDRNEYFAFIEKNAEEGSKELNVSKEKMEQVMKSSVKTIEKALNENSET